MSKEIKEMNLYEKIQAVGNEVKNVEKNLQVGVGTNAYKAVGDSDVTLAVKAAETKFRLVSIPVNQRHISSEIVKTVFGDKEKITYVDNIELTLKIVNLDNPSETETVVTFGKGVDSGDKGFGKASTYARKYALLNAYKIATGEDPDAEKSKDELSQKTISDKRVSVMNYLSLNVKAAQGIMTHFNVETLEELTDQNIDVIYKSYKDKKLVE